MVNQHAEEKDAPATNQTLTDRTDLTVRRVRIDGSLALLARASDPMRIEANDHVGDAGRSLRARVKANELESCVVQSMAQKSFVSRVWNR